MDYNYWASALEPGSCNYLAHILQLLESTGFPCGSAGKESACNAGDLGSIPGLGRSRGEGKGYPLQYSGLENSMDCIVHGVAKSRTQLSNFHFTSLHFTSLESTHPRACAQKQEKPPQREALMLPVESSPLSLQLEKSPRAMKTWHSQK